MMMKELTLKELQLFGLDILEDVHQFCISNHIKYSIAYGTLIGAIRHKGFIPWDDDIDIIMPRCDYEIFCKIYSSTRFKFSSIEKDPNCRITFGRVYDDQKTIVETFIPWKKGESGVWIDIFPVDALEDDWHKYEKRQKSISRSFRYIQNGRKALRKYSLEKSLYRKCRLFLIKVLFFSGRFLPWQIKKLISKSKKFSWGTTKHFGLMSFDSYGLKDYHRNDLFEKCSLMPFENKHFMVLNGYDDYLRNIYGDYMQLPPVEQRTPKQTYLHFYWKQI